MTDHSSPFLLRDTVIETLSGRSLIVAAQPHIDDLRALVTGRRLEAATLLALDADVPVPASMLGNVRVLVLEVDAENEASLRRLANLRVGHPHLAIIAALKRADVTLVRALVRQGVTDVVELPFAPEQLEEQVLDALSTQTENRVRGELGKAIAVVGASGGSGATSILTHLGSAIAKANPGHRGVCLIDLDLQKGNVASYLGIEPAVTMKELLEAGSRLDRELMMSAVTKTDEGFFFIAAPEVISPIERLDVDQLLEMVNIARAEFDYVLVDLPPLWTDWTLSLISWANRVLLLTDTSISSLRQAKRTIELLGSIEVPPNRISLVVNRMERRVFGATRVDDFARALGNFPAVSVTDAGASLRSAQDQGLLLPAVQGKTRFAADIADLAKAIVTGGGMT